MHCLPELHEAIQDILKMKDVNDIKVDQHMQEFDFYIRALRELSGILRIYMKGV